MKFLCSLACGLGMLLLASPAAAQVTVAEGPDFSNTPPGATIVLGVGANSVSGGVATPGDRQDNFQVTVPPGAQLTAAMLALNTSGGFIGGAVFNLADVRNTSGPFTLGFPYGPGTYTVLVYTDFSIGNAWSIAFTVAGAAPVCGNGLIEAGEACDDGNATQCDGCSATCAVALNGCFISGACIADGTAEPGNACRACRRTVSRTTYSPVTAGTGCDDGLFCTAVDSCNSLGTCTGTSRTCSDSLSCTADACDETANICVNPVTSGCLIGGACVADGAPDPANACRACVPATSTAAFSPRPAGSTCDDASFCTVADACDGSGSCGGAPRTCNDADACTSDACDAAAAACSFTAISGCGMIDAGTDTDAGLDADAGTDTDAGLDADAGTDTDAGLDADAGTDTDAGLDADAGTVLDGGPTSDAGRDAAVRDGGMADAAVDGGDEAPPSPAAGGCGCRAAGGGKHSSVALLGFGGLALLLATRRRRNR